MTNHRDRGHERAGFVDHTELRVRNGVLLSIVSAQVSVEERQIEQVFASC